MVGLTHGHWDSTVTTVTHTDYHAVPPAAFQGERGVDDYALLLIFVGNLWKWNPQPYPRTGNMHNQFGISGIKTGSSACAILSG